MTYSEKQAAIEAKDFTYCQLFCDGILGGMTFIVLTPSKKLAEPAARKIAAERGLTIKRRYESYLGREVEELHLYPRTYIVKAREMLALHPEKVYSVSAADIEVTA